MAETPQHNSNQLGWPHESDDIRGHRTKFFDSYGVRLDFNSNVPYNDQLCQTDSSDAYAHDFLSQKTHTGYIDYLQSKKINTQESTVNKHLRHEMGKLYVLSEETDEDGNPVLLRKTMKTNKSGAQEMRLLMMLNSKSVFESLKSVHYDITCHGDESQIVCQFDSLGIFMTKEVAACFVSTCPLCIKRKSKHH